MKLSQIKITDIKLFYDTTANFVEVHDMETAGAILLQLPDGTEIIFTTSEWGQIYIKFSELEQK